MNKVIEWRRWLHEHAELSFHEEQTSTYIINVLEREGIECRKIAETGVLARLGRGESAVVLRADIDALPVGGGVMHACGHDMHTAALLGALVSLKNMKFDGTIFGLFQPGEELLPGGATKVLAEQPFNDYDVCAFYGQHVDPELEVGVFGVRAGEYMASTDELHIKVCGVGGHGAMRNSLKDPVEASAVLITSLLALGNSANSVLSIGRVEADGATNVIPDHVSMQGTLRTFDEDLRSKLFSEIGRCAEDVSRKFDLTVDAEVRKGYPSVINNASLASRAVSALGKIGKVVDLERRMTGEDFGFYTRIYPSLFYRFGVGRTAGKLHTATFNPEEEALDFAVKGLIELAMSN